MSRILAGEAIIRVSVQGNKVVAKIDGMSKAMGRLEKNVRRISSFGAQMRGLGEGVARFASRMTAASAALMTPAPKPSTGARRRCTSR